MAFYAFLSDPPAPRTIFASHARTQQERTDELELIVSCILMDFPEAYRALAAELRRFRSLKGPTEIPLKPAA
jgi:hypothetical protein